MKKFLGYNRGINLGGWLSQCEHEAEHYETFITESDIKQIAEWGLDHVRVPIDYELVRAMDDSYKEEGFELIDRCLEWCKEYKLNMILDLHNTAGYSFDAKGNNFFQNSVLVEKFITLWDEISKRYGKYSDRLCFELLNEVVEVDVIDQWNEIIKTTIQVIRVNAPVTKILVGGVRNNCVMYLSKLEVPYNENIVYTYHFYEPLIFTHQGAYWVDKMTSDFTIEYPNDACSYIDASRRYLPDEHLDIYDYVPTEKIDRTFIKNAFLDAVEVAQARDVAVYCGEYGVIDRVALSSTLKWYQDMNSVFEELGIARAAWTYKGKDFGITDQHYSEIRDELIKLF